MLNFHAQKNKGESGNVAIIALVALVVVAVGALAFLSGQMSSDDSGSTAASTVAAAGDEDANTETQSADAKPAIEPGNPVVAKVNGQDITRLDVFNLIQTLPAQTRQLPVEQLFPVALNQLINTQVINDKTEGVNLDNDPEVKAQLEEAKDNIVRGVYIQQQVEKKVTEDRLKNVYQQYKESFPDVEEAKAAHILVKEEAKAKELIKKLGEGADFAELAKENSTDATAENGGELGYFAEKDVVPAFAKAAFALTPGEYTKTPVQSDFGYHIIKLEDKRKRPPASYEQAKPFLEAQLRRAVLDEVVYEWRQQAKVKIFDINGKEIEPAAGDEKAE